MSRKKIIMITLMILAVVTLIAIIGSNSQYCEKSQKLLAHFRESSDPPLMRPESTTYEEWLDRWQVKLPVTAMLKKGSKSGYVHGISWGFYTRAITYRVYTVHLEIQNQTGYQIDTGNDLYIFETARKPSPGKGTEEVLKLAGGNFRRPPVEDYSSVVEFRGEEEFPFTFGNALPGKALVIDTELQLRLMVIADKLEKVLVVSPALMIYKEKGEVAAFRYILGFVQTSQEKEKSEESQWVLTEKLLLPMTAKALLPLVKEKDGLLWRRVVTAHWAGEYCTELAAPTLLSILSAKGKENDALRAAAILALGEGKQTSAFQQIMAKIKDRSEDLEIRNTAIKALGGCPRITFYKKANPSKLEPNSRANRFFGKQKQILLKNTPVFTKFGVGWPF